MLTPHINKLLIEHQRRLQKLEEQKARFGINTPPEVLIEIEDIKAEIENLQLKIKTLLNFNIESNNENLLPKSTIVDWGDAPDVNIFYGRNADLNNLESWVLVDKCRVITVNGIGGVGKTSLTTKVAKRVENKFDFVIWRSLRDAPLLIDLLVEWIHVLSRQLDFEHYSDTKQLISKLMLYLRKHKCLFVLDNVESILATGYSGNYIEGHEDYSFFFSINWPNAAPKHLFNYRTRKAEGIDSLRGY